MERSTPREILTGLMDFVGKDLVDAGCGDGKIAHFLAGQGAAVAGLDVKRSALDAARAAPSVNNESFIEAPAEAMPFDDQSRDVVLFHNSLHHIDPSVMDQALDEARRVLRPDGALIVAEPRAAGSRYEVGKAVDDEAEVRRAAWAAVEKTAASGYARETELEYIFERPFDSFEALREQICHNETRRANFAANEAEIRAKFDEMATPRDGAFVLDQPIRVLMLRKTG
ncbi:MAG: class I SAM-dependent methyltransferase [Alphaproteobacteria bacterium]